jgi:hypothetical protein
LNSRARKTGITAELPFIVTEMSKLLTEMVYDSTRSTGTVMLKGVFQEPRRPFVWHGMNTTI